MTRNGECDMLKNSKDVTMDNQHPSSCDESLEKVQRLEGSPKDTFDKVYCRICHKMVYSMTGSRSNHLREVHQMTKEDYSKLYPQAPLYSEKCTNDRRKAQKSSQKRFECMTKNEVFQYFSKHNASIWNSHSEEKKAEIIKKRGEAKSRYFKNNPDKAKELSQAGVDGHTEESYEKMRQSLMEYHSQFTPEQRFEMTRKARSSSAKLKEYEYKGKEYILRSYGEFRLIQMFVDNKIQYEYEPIRFRHSDGWSYLPDFYLPEYNLILEAKGDWYYDEKYEKLSTELVNNNGYHYTLLLNSVAASNSFDIFECIHGALSSSALHLCDDIVYSLVKIKV